MKITSQISSIIHRGRCLLLALSLLGTVAMADSFPARLDDFATSESTSLKTMRLVIDDAGIGGKSTATPTYRDGILRMEGSIAPSRGQPGFISLVLLLSPSGEAVDLSDYKGIELRIRVLKGGFSVVAASTEVVNYDYHSAPVTRGKDFKTVRIPFKDMKRVWSEQTSLNLETLTSINLVASGMQPGSFLYEVDSVGFYR